MYKLKPINDIWPKIEVPDCMYNMKIVVNLKLEETAEYPNINIRMNEVDTLSARQEKILIQLEQFKKQLQGIRSGLNVITKPANQSCVKVQKGFVLKLIDNQYLNDLVVNSNPKYIPYCLLALKKIWQDRLSLNINFHTHSSVAKLDNNVLNFMDKVTAIKNVVGLPKIGITLIWHEDVGANTELIATLASYAPLHGEVTLLRWLTCIGPNEFNGKINDKNAVEIDSLLDLCFLLSNNSTDTKERLKFLRILNARLGKQQFFGGSSVSIADVGVSSTVKQGNINDLTPALKSWLQHISTILGY